MVMDERPFTLENNFSKMFQRENKMIAFSDFFFSLRNIEELFPLFGRLGWGQERFCYQEDKRYFSPVWKKRQKRSKNTGFVSHLCGENIKFV